MTQHIVASRSVAARADAGVLLARGHQRRTADHRARRHQLLEETPEQRAERHLEAVKARADRLGARILEALREGAPS